MEGTVHVGGGVFVLFLKLLESCLFPFFLFRGFRKNKKNENVKSPKYHIITIEYSISPVPAHHLHCLPAKVLMCRDERW